MRWLHRGRLIVGFENDVVNWPCWVLQGEKAPQEKPILLMFNISSDPVICFFRLLTLLSEVYWYYLST